MDTKETAETTAPSVAPARPAPAPKTAGEPEPEVPVPSVPLSGLRDDSLNGLGVAFSGLSVGGPEGKEKEKEKQAVDRGVEEAYTRDGHGPPDEAPFEDTPEESAPSASNLPAVPSPTTTTLPAARPATFSPATTPPMAEGLGFTGMPYPTYGVTPARLCHLWQLQSANQWHPAPTTPLRLSVCRAAMRMSITDPRRACT